jgi:hypothetical protein
MVVCAIDASAVRQFRNSFSTKTRIAAERLYDIVWLDYTKCGRVTQDYRDSTIALGKTLVDLNPKGAVLFVIAPTLASDKVADGISGKELLIEKKLRAKDMEPVMVTTACSKDLIKGNNRKRAGFTAWMAFSSCCSLEGSRRQSRSSKERDDNPFARSEFAVSFINSTRPQLIPEELYVIAADVQKNNLPRSAERERHFTERQYSANQTGGVNFATEVVKALLCGVGLTSSDGLTVTNLSPYDGTLESAILALQIESEGLPQMASVSLTTEMENFACAKKMMTNKLIEARRTLHYEASARASKSGRVASKVHSHRNHDDRWRTQVWKSGKSNQFMGVAPTDVFQAAPLAVTTTATKYPKLLICKGNPATQELSIPVDVQNMFKSGGPMASIDRSKMWEEVLKEHIERFPAVTDLVTVPTVTVAVKEEEPPLPALVLPQGIASTFTDLKTKLKVIHEFPGREPSYKWVLAGPKDMSADELIQKGAVELELWVHCVEETATVNAKVWAFAFSGGAWMIGQKAKTALGMGDDTGSVHRHRVPLLDI